MSQKCHPNPSCLTEDNNKKPNILEQRKASCCQQLCLLCLGASWCSHPPTSLLNVSLAFESFISYHIIIIKSLHAISKARFHSLGSINSGLICFSSSLCNNTQFVFKRRIKLILKYVYMCWQAFLEEGCNPGTWTSNNKCAELTWTWSCLFICDIHKHLWCFVFNTSKSMLLLWVF